MAEIETYSNLNDMSEEELVADAMGVKAPEAPVAEEQQVESTPATPLEASDDLSAKLLEALGSTASNDEAAEKLDKSPSPVDADKLKQLDQMFQDTLGVNISSAVERMTSFNQEAEATFARIQEASNQLALQMQAFELKQAWSNDPSVQGQNLDQVVQDRLAALVPIYQKLDEGLQQKLAMAGSQGIVVLWNQVNQGKNSGAPKTVPQGRANIAPNSQARPGAESLSQIIALDDDTAYWSALKSGDYTDDIGIRRR